MRFALFALSAQIGCAFVAALQHDYRLGYGEYDDIVRFDFGSASLLNGRDVVNGFVGGKKRYFKKEVQFLFERSFPSSGERAEGLAAEGGVHRVQKRSAPKSSGGGKDPGSSSPDSKGPDPSVGGTGDQGPSSASPGTGASGDVGAPGAAAAKAEDEKTVIGGVEVEEEYVFSLVVKDKYKESQDCKKLLEDYCKKLKTIDSELKNMDKNVKNLCTNDTGKCDELEKKVTKKCTEIKQNIKEKLRIRPISNDDCNTYGLECFFFDGTCNDLEKDCNELRASCYQNKREIFAREIAFRSLGSSLKKEPDCKKKLKEECSELSKQGKELVELCFSSDEMCNEAVVKIKEKCEALKKNVSDLLGKNGDLLKDGCRSLLEKCYFHGESCEKDQKPACDELVEKCKEQDVIYMPFSERTPIDWKVTWMEKIGLEEIYAKAALEGIMMKDLGKKDANYIMAFLIEGKGDKAKECQDVLKKKEKCEDFRSLVNFIDVEKLCEEESLQEDWCSKFSNGLDELSNELQRILNYRRVSNKGQGPLYFDSLYQLLALNLNRRDCEELQWKCHALEKHFQSKLPSLCRDFESGCYKMGLNNVANDVLEQVLKGLLQSLGDPSSNKCQQKLLKECVTLRGKSVELYFRCMFPEDTCNYLERDIQQKANDLRTKLDNTRDEPTKNDCQELLEKCEMFEKDVFWLERPCNTMKKNCHHLTLAEEIKNFLLEEETNSLKDKDNCIKKLEEKCTEIRRKNDRKYDVVCVYLDESCELMVQRVKNNCRALSLNMDTVSIRKHEKFGDKDDCLLFGSYCKKLSPNCDSLMKESDGSCKKLEGKCDSILEKNKLEKMLMYELGSNLESKEKCEKDLQRFCTQKGTSGTTALYKLCTDPNEQNNTKVEEQLCQKLVREVKEQCPTLKEELDQANDELKKRQQMYEKILQEANEKTKSSNLNVFFVFGEKKAQRKLMKRDITGESITDADANAVSLTVLVLNMYVELKEKCKKLQEECKLKEACPKCETACNGINVTCRKVKAPEIKAPTIEPAPQSGSPKPGQAGGKQQGEERGDSKKDKDKECEKVAIKDEWVTKTETKTQTITKTHTATSTVTVESTRRCKPTRCKPGDDTDEHVDDEDEVMPNGGMRWLPGIGMMVLGLVMAVA